MGFGLLTCDNHIYVLMFSCSHVYFYSGSTPSDLYLGGRVERLYGLRNCRWR